MSMKQKMLLDHAVPLLNSGKYDEAETILLEAYDEPGDLDFYVRNNLGAIYLKKGDYEKAYTIMYKNKNEVKHLNPYYFAKMADVCSKLGKSSEANRMLKSGIKLYEVGNKKYASSVWDEYGYTLLESCITLGKYKDGLKLYRNSMKYSEYNQIHGLAVKMAISLNRLDQAKIYASKTGSLDINRLVESFEEGLLPVVDVCRYFNDDSFEAHDVYVMLGLLVSNRVSINEKCDIAKFLITHLDNGSEIANCIFGNDYYEIGIKQMALDALGEIGLYQYGTYRKVLYQGKEMHLISGKFEIGPDDLVSLSILNEVEGLEVDDALITIQEATAKLGFISPCLMEKQIKLFREKGYNDMANNISVELENFRNK